MAAVFEDRELGTQHLPKNRIVMAPMTRTRTATGDVTNVLTATYYGQCASADLNVTEATDVSAHSKRYASPAGIYTDAQLEGWKRVMAEDLRNGGLIFLQMSHAGRMAHTSWVLGGEAPPGVSVERASESDVFAYAPDYRLTFVCVSTPWPIRTDEILGLGMEFMLNRPGVACLHVVSQRMPSTNMEGSELTEANLSSDLVRKIRAIFRKAIVWRGRFKMEHVRAILNTGWVNQLRLVAASSEISTCRHPSERPVIGRCRSIYLLARKCGLGYTNFTRFSPNS